MLPLPMKLHLSNAIAANHQNWGMNIICKSEDMELAGFR